MKVIQDLKQGSNEWLEWRKSGIGGSDIASIMHLSPWKDITDLWLEKTGQKEPEDLSGNFIVQRGHALEPEARKLFEQLAGKEFWPCLFQSEELEFAKVSCDGYDNQESIIEIKCNGNKSHEAAIMGLVPPYYMAQIQYSLAVSGAKVCHYISYNPDHASPLVSFEVLPDPSYQDEIMKRAKEFWEVNVKLKEKPAIMVDEQEIKDKKIQLKVLKLKELTAKIDDLDSQKKPLEEEIKQYLMQNNLKKANFSNVFFSEIERKGNVDYSKIPELEGVDLEKYRKKSSKFFKIDIKDDQG